MKLDVTNIRYLTKDDWRVLTAVEMGMRNHNIVPVELIVSIAGLRHGGVHKIVSTLLKFKLLNHDRSSGYDGYKLNFAGYDYLALHTMLQRGNITAVANQIGVGKESDIFLVTNVDGDNLVLKLHRLGRVSFRAIRSKRDYLQHRKSASWLYMSRLAALKEFSFMKALHAAGFPTPTPIDCNRHCVLMTLANGYPLHRIGKITHPAKVYDQMMGITARLARAGLIHCDFNEFNAIVDDDEVVTMIDFPQMVSTSHANAEWYFNRDVDCIRAFFKRKHHYESDDYPRFHALGARTSALDVEVEASGFTPAMAAEFEDLMTAQRATTTVEAVAAGDHEADSADSDDTPAAVPAAADGSCQTDHGDAGADAPVAAGAGAGAGAAAAVAAPDTPSVARGDGSGATGVGASAGGCGGSGDGGVAATADGGAVGVEEVKAEPGSDVAEAEEEAEDDDDHDDDDDDDDDGSDPDEYKYRRTALQRAEDEAEKLGRVPDGIRWRPHRSGRGRGPRAKGGKVSVRDAVRKNLVAKEKRMVRTRMGNQQKGRDRRRVRAEAQDVTW